MSGLQSLLWTPQASSGLGRHLKIHALCHLCVSTRCLVSRVQVTSVWSLLLGSPVVFLRLLDCADVCDWEGNGVLPTLVPHVSTCLHVTSMVMVQAPFVAEGGGSQIERASTGFWGWLSLRYEVDDGENSE
ncbi:hypothetical protein C8R45DRAFT_1089832 [Mycena sanguinolenta]|nr:hypothetical protein C8R45DRAFT_1089832 [Mycena sanguinolenta]